MLLQDLHAFGQSRGLLTATKKVFVTHVLSLRKAGVTLEAVKELRVDALKEKRASNVMPYTGYDSVEYVLGVGRERKAGDGLSPFEAFWQRLETVCSASDDDKALAAVRAARKDTSWLKACRKRAADDEAGNIVVALGEEPLLNRPLIRKYLRKQFTTSMVVSKTASAVCLLTGELCEPSRLHAPIHGVPGCGGDFPLVSFNFRSAEFGGGSGKLQGLNFPVSRRAVVTYTSALNTLIERNMVRLSASTCLVVWGPKEVDALLTVLRYVSKEERAQNDGLRERRAAWAAACAMADGETHLLLLKGSKGRIAVLGYEVLPTVEVASSLRFYRDTYGKRSWVFAYDEVDGKQRAHLERWDVGGSSVLGELFSTGPKHNQQPLDPFLKTDVVWSLLLGRRLPAALATSLEAAMTPTDVFKNKWWARAQMRWLDFEMAIETRDQGKRLEEEENSMASDVNGGGGGPRQSEFLDSRDLDDGAVRIGRLISVIDEMRREYHPRHVPSMAGTALWSAGQSPCGWLAEGLQQVEVYRGRLRASGPRRWAIHEFLAAQFEEIMRTPQNERLDDGVRFEQRRPLSGSQQAAMLRAYHQQRLFSSAMRAWDYEKRGVKPTAEDVEIEEGAEVSEQAD